MTTQADDTLNLLAQPYSELYDSIHTGNDTDVLAALRNMVETCPEIGDWLAREVGVTRTNLHRTLEWIGGEPTEFVADGPGDREIIEMEALLDSAAAYGTLAEVLDELCESDPRAAETLQRNYGLDGREPESTTVIAKDMGRSGEMVRRYARRGCTKIKARMEARGQTP